MPEKCFQHPARTVESSTKSVGRILPLRELPCEGKWLPNLPESGDYLNLLTNHGKRRLEEVTKELDRIKRARSFQEEDSASPAPPLMDPQRPNSLTQNGGSLPQLDTGNPFGLNELDNASSQVSFQSLEGYHLNALQISDLFRQYERFYSSSPSQSPLLTQTQFCEAIHASPPNTRYQNIDQRPSPEQSFTVLDNYSHLIPSP